MNISNGVDASEKGGLSRMSFGGFFVLESEPQSKEEIDRVCDSVFESFDMDIKMGILIAESQVIVERDYACNGSRETGLSPA
ncbi:hypothetical protein QYF36_010201 [Acer negundo]|nr:hypothetical protein QYF36_010201 [Acer negundo]